MELIFEWDKNKSKANLRKHKISFDEAKTVFEDELLITFPDDFDPAEENRFISIGFSANSRLLLVVHTEYSENNDVIVIRIISCRKATKSEREVYEKGK
jgi:uncharacterized DUF497 family protein